MDWDFIRAYIECQYPIDITCDGMSDYESPQ